VVGVVGGFVVCVVSEGDGRSGGAFVVDGPSPAAADATAFLAWLASHGRGSYTQRAYALGLAHFLTWLDRAGVELCGVDRRVIAEYVVAFRSGADDGLVLGRQPRTVNHRLCVLASFFEFLAFRDREDGGGVWAQRPCPVPVGSSAMNGSHGMPAVTRFGVVGAASIASGCRGGCHVALSRRLRCG
jgi:Phage integrase, N-terminal SAM-like domain